MHNFCAHAEEFPQHLKSSVSTTQVEPQQISPMDVLHPPGHEELVVLIKRSITESMEMK